LIGYFHAVCPLLSIPTDDEPHISIHSQANIPPAVPRFLSKYTTAVRHAPITHITSFLLLHELTAILPIFALAGFFHYSRWMPPFIGEGRWVSDGVEKFGNYFRRKGWLGNEKKRRYKWWGRGEGTTRIVVEYVVCPGSRSFSMGLDTLQSVMIA